MCSFPAYSTSAPRNGSAAEDCVVETPSEDMADVSSKGLLPQLIDLLYAFAEGQKLLASKVRDARVEHTRHSTSLVESQNDSFDDSIILGIASPNASITTPKSSTDNGVCDKGRTSPKAFSNDSPPEPNMGVITTPVSAMVPEERSSSDPPAATVTHAGPAGDPSSETHVQTDRLGAARIDGEATAAPLNRDYNFFDELDTRLAGLHDSPDWSGDQ